MEVKIATTAEERKDAFYVRMKVFVEEQNVPKEEEMDEFDETAIHFVGYEGGKAVAAGRVRFIDDFGKLERICVMKAYRGKHFGRALMEQMEETIRKHGHHKATLNAQTHAETFYAQQGYETVSDVFMDAGIPHVTMVKEFSNG